MYLTNPAPPKAMEVAFLTLANWKSEEYGGKPTLKQTVQIPFTLSLVTKTEKANIDHFSFSN